MFYGQEAFIVSAIPISKIFFKKKENQKHSFITLKFTPVIEVIVRKTCVILFTSKILLSFFNY